MRRCLAAMSDRRLLAWRAWRLRCVELLLEAKADLTPTDGDGDTALENAWKAGRKEVVEALQQEERRRRAERRGGESGGHRARGGKQRARRRP